WFGSDKEAFRYMSPDVNERVKKTFKDLEENIKILKKYIPIDEEKIKIEPIKITGSRYNEEDVNSRLYRHVEKAAVSGSITAEINKIQFTHPVLKALSKMEIVDIGLYAKFLISIGASGGVDRYKLIEHEKLENNEPYFQFTSDGCIAVGVEAKLLKAKDQIDFYVDGHAKGCLTGRIKYSFYENKMEGSIYIPPIVLEGTIKIKTSGTLKFQLIDWNDNIKVTDKIPLGKVEHTF
ncbi:MAG: hypothetical protein OEM04_05020, partial [Flavobacteriaceae bacterium]|nr:hypothetical protein [Flavobacteriaceae bacterium]